MSTEQLNEIKKAFTPTGKLRASINVGNPILTKKTDNPAEPGGVSVDLARELAKRLQVELELVVFESAGESVKAVTAEQADFGFFAIDPLRGEGIHFTAPYVLITGSYLVPENSPFQHITEVDQAGINIVVGKGSAYDLYLSRTLQNATIVRAPTSPTVVDVFVKEQCQVAAGVTQQLESDMQRHPGYRLLPEKFMTIEQAMGVPKSRGKAAANYLAAFVEEMKASGFVADALARHHVKGAAVAPLTKS